MEWGEPGGLGVGGGEPGGLRSRRGGESGGFRQGPGCRAPHPLPLTPRPLFQAFGLIKGACVGLLIDASALGGGPQGEAFQRDLTVSRGAGPERPLAPAPVAPPAPAGAGLCFSPKQIICLPKSSSHLADTQFRSPPLSGRAPSFSPEQPRPCLSPRPGSWEPSLPCAPRPWSQTSAPIALGLCDCITNPPAPWLSHL